MCDVHVFGFDILTFVAMDTSAAEAVLSEIVQKFVVATAVSEILFFLCVCVCLDTFLLHLPVLLRKARDGISDGARNAAAEAEQAGRRVQNAAESG
jgi:hypothetical protein